MLGQVRSFFKIRHVLEIDCPSLVRCPPIDANIEVMQVSIADTEIGYLHTSPEYAMKRLLADGLGDIFYLGHVFRKGESGDRHNPEFTMIEWYRTAIPFRQLIDETCELIQLFIGSFPTRLMSYRQAFQTYTGIDPFSDADLPEIARHLGIETPADSVKWERDTWLHLILSHAIEPSLGRNEITVLCDYPPSQAALAQIIEKDGIHVAERFEAYFNGIELSNGYHELADATEQRRRFQDENVRRQLQGKESYPLDELFLSALETGLPDACGVSVGFDRLMLIRHKAQAIQSILPMA
jgi:lysyl-tRNA synthetase class 2